MDESITKPTLNVNVNEKEDDLTHNEIDDDKKSVQFNNKKDKSTISDSSKYFNRIEVGDDGKERTSCNKCNQKLVVKKYDILI